jgi:hypothetical protein
MRTHRAVGCALVLAAAGCAAPGDAPPPKAAAPAPRAVAAPGPVTLRNPGFELDARPGANCATGWSCTMHADPKSFRFFADETGGRRSFCVEPVKKEPWALVAQGVPIAALRGARLRFSIAMRLTDAAGSAGPWAQVRGPARRPKTDQKLVKQASGWETHAVEFDVPAESITVEVGAMFRGTGRACFDDARLEVLQPGKNPV